MADRERELEEAMLGGASLRNCHSGVREQITGGNRSVTVSNNVYVTYPTIYLLVCPTCKHAFRSR